MAGVLAVALWANRAAVVAMPASPATPQGGSQRRGELAEQGWLESLPREPAAVRVDTRLAVARLEDRIAWLDDTLSDSQASGDPLIRIHELRAERARLVDSLVRVRYAEQLSARAR
ncbi:MAG: hypothetical protein U1F11_09970 [Steroidobacteraceae bacterium]